MEDILGRVYMYLVEYYFRLLWNLLGLYSESSCDCRLQSLPSQDSSPPESSRHRYPRVGL